MDFEGLFLAEAQINADADSTNALCAEGFRRLLAPSLLNINLLNPWKIPLISEIRGKYWEYIVENKNVLFCKRSPGNIIYAGKHQTEVCFSFSEKIPLRTGLTSIKEIFLELTEKTSPMYYCLRKNYYLCRARKAPYTSGGRYNRHNALF